MTMVKPKSNSVITTRLESGKLIFAVKDVGELVLDMALVHADNLAYATVHGLTQRVQDSAAIAFEANGRRATAKEKFDAMAELVNHYNSGSDQWRLARSGEGVGRSYLLNALCELYATKSREELAAWLKTLGDKEKRALENEPRIKPKIDAQRAKGAEQVDVGGLLAGLES